MCIYLSYIHIYIYIDSPLLTTICLVTFHSHNGNEKSDLWPLQEPHSQNPGSWQLTCKFMTVASPGVTWSPFATFLAGFQWAKSMGGADSLNNHVILISSHIIMYLNGGMGYHNSPTWKILTRDSVKATEAVYELPATARRWSRLAPKEEIIQPVG